MILYTTHALELVKFFHKKMGFKAPTKITPYSKEEATTRKAIIDEEYNEFVEALDTKDEAKVYKEASDLLFTVYGALVEAGLNTDILHYAFHEVYNSNMTKTPPQGNGAKAIKGDDYKPADIESILKDFKEIMNDEQ